jgi:galactose mutarotase-like enzyme
MADARGIGVAEENVLIQAGSCSLTILPHLGGKIASLRLRGRELLQAPLAPLAPRTCSMPFDESDASGWDECLPSVAACTVETADGEAHIPDHGDLWRVAWRKKPLDERKSGAGKPASAPPESEVTLLAECFSLPLALDRTVSLATAGSGWRIDLKYKVTHTGKVPVPWSWAAHPLFSAEAGDRIVLPGSIRELLVEGSGGGRLGKTGARVAWPQAVLSDGSTADLSLAQTPASGIGDKLFAGPLAAHENWCALERPRAGVRLTVRFDPAATPYLGLWICCGGWPERPGPKQNCVAMEPATAPVDSLARTGPWSRTLGPGESSSWQMHVDVEII